MSDLIDRQATVEALLKCGEYYNGNNEASRGVAQCIGVVYDLPTIEERKTGKWEQDNPFTKPRCSECGEPCFGLHGFDYTLTPYCPNCGADMRGGDER